MTRHTNAARDLAALLADASPDVAQANAAALAALRDVVAADIAAYLQPGRTAERAMLDNAGDLGGAVPSEHDEQATLFRWAELQEGQHPELANLFAIPNGGARHPAVAAQLKAEGVRAGVPDLFLAVRRGTGGQVWGGLFLEMKRHPNKPTPAQVEWIARLRASGYMAVVCYGATEAQQCIMAYLQQGEDGAA